MSEPPAGPRRYNEKEVSLLLRRASELQRALPSAANPTGLTLTELEEIAAEAGLDVSLLRQAANELDTGAVPGAGGLGPALAGGPLKILLERMLPFEAPESAFASLVPVVQIAADAPGQASQVGRSFTWHSQSPSNPRGLQVVVSVQSGQTLVRVEERYGALAGSLFGGILGGVGGGVGLGVGGALAGTLGSVAIGIAFPTVVIAGTYLGTRALFRSIVRKRAGVVERLMARIVEELTRAADESSSP